MFLSRIGLTAALVFAGATLVSAADPVQQHNSNAVWFENWVGLSNATLRVSAPNGEITDVHAPSGTPVFELDRAKAMDGIYRYELNAATEEKAEIINPIDSGRGDDQQSSTAVPYYANGHFVVSRGAIITPEDVKEDDG